MRLNPLTLLLAGWSCLALSCAHRPIRMNMLGTSCSGAGLRLKEAWEALSEALRTPGGCDQDNGVRCESLRARIERLSIDCPGNSEVVMANALLAFDAHNYVRTQQLLDELFSLGVSNPEAAILRTRIALEQGNIPLALRFAEQQVRQNGDSAGLRETYASALYLAGRWGEASEQLLTAQKLGAPAWRIEYARGLVAEGQGKFDEALLRYREALQARPDWRKAQSRLQALIASGKASQANAKTQPAPAAPKPLEQARAESGPQAVQTPVLPGPAQTPHADPPPTESARTERRKGDAGAATLHNQQGRDLLSRGKYWEAIAELTAAIEAQPDFAPAYNARGFAYYLLGDYPRALAGFDKAIELDPNDQRAQQNRALALKAAAVKE